MPCGINFCYSMFSYSICSFKNSIFITFFQLFWQDLFNVKIQSYHFINTYVSQSLYHRKITYSSCSWKTLLPTSDVYELQCFLSGHFSHEIISPYSSYPFQEDHCLNMRTSHTVLCYFLRHFCNNDAAVLSLSGPLIESIHLFFFILFDHFTFQ